ncbi:MAG: putative electron transport protein YccM [Firmicutes bacterium ADurb.Bin356]|nr:MAG: putative electron transport protein YccM [Firmicutes bacterium ADurb.Bin356]
MAKKLKKAHSLRHIVQIGTAAITNGYLEGFKTGSIYTGPLKVACVPGLNCYSCPGALGSCPIGSLQAVLSNRGYNFSFYVVGFLFVFGALLGRFICGWLCPFGLVQDLLNKLPFYKKLKKLPGDKALRYLKYFILAAFVILLPSVVLDIAGQGSPWFCKFICPSGTLFAGIPLVAINSSFRPALGGLFVLKVSVLTLLLLLSLALYRPFCRYLCPLGAIYGLFNPIALYRFKVDKTACINCGACQKACPIDIPVFKQPNSQECIRCGACRYACPVGAIHTTIERRAKKSGIEQVYVE